MKFYVDEMPRTCYDCPLVCHYCGTTAKCIFLKKDKPLVEDGISYRIKDCPLELLDNNDIETPKAPIQPTELHRYGMGELYEDYGCPTCGYFLAYEPVGRTLIMDNEVTRCQHCGQLIRWGKIME